MWPELPQLYKSVFLYEFVQPRPSRDSKAMDWFSLPYHLETIRLVYFDYRPVDGLVNRADKLGARGVNRTRVSLFCRQPTYHLSTRANFLLGQMFLCAHPGGTHDTISRFS